MITRILLAANDRDVMGERVNPRWINALGWAAAAASAIAVIGLVCTWGRS